MAASIEGANFPRHQRITGPRSKHARQIAWKPSLGKRSGKDASLGVERRGPGCGHRDASEDLSSGSRIYAWRCVWLVCRRQTRSAFCMGAVGASAYTSALSRIFVLKEPAQTLTGGRAQYVFFHPAGSASVPEAFQWSLFTVEGILPRQLF